MTYTNGAQNGTASNSSNGTANGKANGAVKNGHASEGDVFLDERVAISPNTPQLVPGLLKDILNHGLSFSGDHDAKARSNLLDAARSLVHALETPREAMIRYCWSQVGTHSTLPNYHIRSTDNLVNCLCGHRNGS